MAYVISDECVACGTCASECPADAISVEMASTLSTLMHVLSAALAKQPVRPALSLLSNSNVNGLPNPSEKQLGQYSPTAF